MGYALLILGIILSLISKNSYFSYLTKKLKQINVKTIVLIFILSGTFYSSSAQTGIGAGIPDVDDNLVKEFRNLDLFDAAKSGGWLIPTNLKDIYSQGLLAGYLRRKLMDNHLQIPMPIRWHHQMNNL